MEPGYSVWKLGFHPQNLKYGLIIDSEKVPWGKVEIELKGAKIEI